MTSLRTLAHCPARALVALLLTSVIISGCDDAQTPTSPTPTPSGPATDTWSTQIGAQGSASRSIEASAAGSIELTLSSTTPESVVLGLSVGVPRAGNAGCLPTPTVRASAAGTPQIVSDVAAGIYCVQVFDLGTLTGTTHFTVQIKRP